MTRKEYTYTVKYYMKVINSSKWFLKKKIYKNLSDATSFIEFITSGNSVDDYTFVEMTANFEIVEG